MEELTKEQVILSLTLPDRLGKKQRPETHGSGDGLTAGRRFRRSDRCLNRLDVRPCRKVKSGHSSNMPVQSRRLHRIT
jgi:hypothetical protein